MDISGSMSTPSGNTVRLELAKLAALKVLDTLSKYDWATIITFDSSA